MAIVKDGKTKDFIVGFSDLGNTDSFSNEMLEWRIARSDVIEYAGDLLHPPTSSKSSKKSALRYLDSKKKKNLRGRNDSDDDSDSDY